MSSLNQQTIGSIYCLFLFPSFPLIENEEPSHGDYDHLDNFLPPSFRRNTHPEETDKDPVVGSDGKHSNGASLSEPDREPDREPEREPDTKAEGTDRPKESVAEDNDSKCCSIM